MVYTIMVLAMRKAGVPHEEFKLRYERHMRMVAGLAGDAAPISHVRLYPQHDNISDRPVLLAGNAEDMPYSAVVLMDFQDESAWQRFHAALSTPAADRKIMEDEAGFWEREGMKVMVVDRRGG